MSETVEGRILQPIQFARENGEFAGVLAVAELPRLAELAEVAASEVRYQINGTQEKGKYFLHLHLSGHVRLQCQRCLEQMDWPLNGVTHYRLVAQGTPWPEDDMERNDCDAIPVGDTLIWPELVEEEVLLTLPMVPRHEACAMPAITRHHSFPNKE